MASCKSAYLLVMYTLYKNMIKSFKLDTIGVNLGEKRELVV